jgi:formylglycine-generating enzyme required for sulfatase activity
MTSCAAAAGYRGGRDRAFGSNRVNRGGSWDNDAQNCRTANRNRNNASNRNNNLGFRPAAAPAWGMNFPAC